MTTHPTKLLPLLSTDFSVGTENNAKAGQSNFAGRSISETGVLGNNQAGQPPPAGL